MSGRATAFPLSAVVGQDDLKLALMLHAVDPRLGGVLIRGEKGSGKSTAARGLAALLPPAGDTGEPAPFVELPLGATEDRVIGTLDLESALVEGRRRLQPGLLAAAHQGVLYVDEVNLLPDHLVDVLIDAAAFGVNRVERDGMTAEHPCRFVLVGSMNPEEGELRPQLLDRFGLAVEVIAPRDPDLRTEVVRRRLAYDADPEAFAARYAPEEQTLREAIAAAGRHRAGVSVPDGVLALASGLCAELDAEGLRADLVLARGAVALAALEGRTEASAADVVRLARLALGHRRRRGPLDSPGLDQAEVDAALDRLEQGEGPGAAPDGGDTAADPDRRSPRRNDRSDERRIEGSGPAVAPAAGVQLALQTSRPSGVLGRRARGPSPRGGLVAAQPPPPGGAVDDLAVVATVQAGAARRALEATPVVTPDPTAAARRAPETAPATNPDQGADGPPAGAGTMVEPGDLRQAVREARTANLVVLCVDASGSMGAERRMEAAKGAVLSLLVDAYQRRDRVALVTFAGEEARVVLRPTGSVEVARARLAELPTGGRTPLAAGLRQALDVARSARRTDPSRRPVLVVVTDGRATSGTPEPTAAALAAAAEVARTGLEALVVDAEDTGIRLGLARSLAEAMGARYLALPALAGDTLARAVAAVTAPAPGGSAKL